MAKKIQVVTEEKDFENKLFLTVEEMSIVSGLGQNFLRSLIEKSEVDYISVGAKKLLRKSAILDWYVRNKKSAVVEA